MSATICRIPVLPFVNKVKAGQTGLPGDRSRRNHAAIGSPVIGVSDSVEHLTQFVVFVQRWSDGTEYREGPAAEHHH
jgi:hypothetical protein